MSDRIVIYQVLVRLFGNDVTHPVPSGTIEQNGCGKMNDFTLHALRSIKSLGANYIWYTGLLEHATQTDYTSYGIRRDHSAIVKGKAGSPYAIKDYYDIDPDLASKPERRMKEFNSLVERTHNAGLKMIMDFVPNHLARQYYSDSKPQGIRDFGQDDNTSQPFCNQNNFYYIPNHALHCQFNMAGIENEPYHEMPAKATGNDVFSASPSKNDWYETVKLNYGVDYCGGGRKYFNPIPDTWHKMLDILYFWASKGVDGFRCDMIDMVPMEFWEWAIRKTKERFPLLLFIGEAYNPDTYREYIHRANFDYLYDKVGMYDTLRAVTCMENSASQITTCWQQVDNIRTHMLYFLENHDEQRMASNFFAADAQKGIPALGVVMFMGCNPAMIYCGQEFGEQGMEEEGFSGMDGRTTIFDYWRMKSVQQWRSKGRYLLKNVDTDSQAIYKQYKKIINLALKEKCFAEGLFYDLMYVNLENPMFDKDRIYTFLRATDKDKCLVVCNFSDQEGDIDVNIPQHALDFIDMSAGRYKARDMISGNRTELDVAPTYPVRLSITPWSVAAIKILENIE